MMDDTDWTLIDFGERVVAVNKRDAGAEKSAPVSACPKCGKPLKARGQHFHIRSCKGDGR